MNNNKLQVQITTKVDKLQINSIIGINPPPPTHFLQKPSRGFTEGRCRGGSKKHSLMAKG